MKIHRIVSGAVLAATAFACAPAAAQDYPAAAVRIVVPFPPGGSTDIVGRLLAAHLGDAWKQTVVVDNRPGGNGMLGPTFVARSKPDGYTLLLAAPSIATAVTSMKDMPINPEKDLDGVSQLISTDYAVAVNSKQPMKTLKELIAAAKANPGKLNYGYFAVGSRLTTEYFSTLAGIKMNPVGYKGENPMVTALASGEIEVGLSTIAAMREFANRGEVRILAITGEKRSPVFPDVQTAAEAGLPAFDSSVWFGIFAPAGTPAAIKNKVSEEIGRFVRQADVIAKMESFGLTPKSSTPEQMSRHLSQDIKRAVDTAKLAGIEPQ